MRLRSVDSNKKYTYLENLLVVAARRGLQGLIESAITESPSSCSIHAKLGSLLECRCDLVLCAIIRCHVHQPVSIEAIEVESPPMLHKVGTSCPNKALPSSIAEETLSCRHPPA